MYTINNFLEIKKEIYEYCLNLTMTRNSNIPLRHKDRADDLFQDVYLASYNYLPTLKREVLDLKEYTTKIKMITFWTHCSKFDKRYKKNKINSNLKYYEEDSKSIYHMEEEYYEDPKVFQDIINHPDFRFYTRNLNNKELDIVKLIVDGYTFKEIIQKYNKKLLNLVLTKLATNQVERYKSVKSVKEKSINDLEFLKSKIKSVNFKQIFNKKYYVKLYSMYLQGDDYKLIAKRLNKTKNQIGVEIFRIKNKLK